MAKAPRIMGTLLLLFTAGCASPPMYFGNPIPADRLGSLVMGKSTDANIRAALGPPDGYGMWRNSREDAPKDLRVYEYERQTSTQANVAMLLVFERNGIYQGHFWFGADDLLK
jgi:hypothetical protein